MSRINFQQVAPTVAAVNPLSFLAGAKDSYANAYKTLQETLNGAQTSIRDTNTAKLEDYLRTAKDANQFNSAGFQEQFQALRGMTGNEYHKKDISKLMNEMPDTLQARTINGLNITNAENTLHDNPIVNQALLKLSKNANADVSKELGQLKGNATALYSTLDSSKNSELQRLSTQQNMRIAQRELTLKEEELKHKVNMGQLTLQMARQQLADARKALGLPSEGEDSGGGSADGGKVGLSSEQQSNMQTTYNYLTGKKGFSHNAALAVIGEIGRETGFQNSAIFGTHSDQSNGKTNAGIVSWQGDRRTNLNSMLQQRGLVDQNGRMLVSPKTLEAQLDYFFDQDMKNDAKVMGYKYDLGQFKDPNYTLQQGADYLGRKVIRWNPQVAPSGVTNRETFYNAAKGLFGSGAIPASLARPGYTNTTPAVSTQPAIPLGLARPGYANAYRPETPAIPVSRTNSTTRSQVAQGLAPMASNPFGNALLTGLSMYGSMQENAPSTNIKTALPSTPVTGALSGTPFGAVINSATGLYNHLTGGGVPAKGKEPTASDPNNNLLTFRQGITGQQRSFIGLPAVQAKLEADAANAPEPIMQIRNANDQYQMEQDIKTAEDLYANSALNANKGKDMGTNLKSWGNNIVKADKDADKNTVRNVQKAVEYVLESTDLSPVQQRSMAHTLYETVRNDPDADLATMKQMADDMVIEHTNIESRLSGMRESLREYDTYEDNRQKYKDAEDKLFRVLMGLSQ